MRWSWGTPKSDCSSAVRPGSNQSEANRRTGSSEASGPTHLPALLSRAAGLPPMAGLKGDLGALVLGVLVARHQKAEEVASTMFGFKYPFLLGFFLSIGLSGPLTLGLARRPLADRSRNRPVALLRRRGSAQRRRPPDLPTIPRGVDAL